MTVFALIIIIGYETISADPLAVRGSAPRSLCKGDGRDFFGATRILLLFECFEGAVPRHLGAGSFVFFMDSKGDVKHFFGARFAWLGHESCCCSNVSKAQFQGI